MHTSATRESRSRDDLLALADLTLAEYLRYPAGYGGAGYEPFTSYARYLVPLASSPTPAAAR